MAYAKLTAKIRPDALAACAAGDSRTYAGKNYGQEKETVSAYSVIAATKQGMREVVTCRVYMGRSRNSSSVWATVWINGRSYYGSGSGQAGGYGYHKESAAVDTALAMAGVKLSRSVSGMGETQTALEATARALGYSGQLLFVSH